MRMHKSMAGFVFLAVSLPAYAGVEMNLVTEVPAGDIEESITVLAQDGKIRMEEIGDSSGEDMAMVFVDNKFIVIDHGNQSYIVMDEAMVAEVGSKMNAAMAEMKAQLAGMPPEQRAMVEQMMEQQMGGIMGEAEDSGPPLRVVETGSGSWESGDCTQYSVYEGDEKTQEVCAAALSDVEGADEALEAFTSMAKFMKSLAESMPGPMGASMAENPMLLMEQIDGFPVHTVDYANGAIASETTLKSVEEKSLDPALFTVPDGYVQQDPFAGQ